MTPDQRRKSTPRTTQVLIKRLHHINGTSSFVLDPSKRLVLVILFFTIGSFVFSQLLFLNSTGGLRVRRNLFTHLFFNVFFTSLISSDYCMRESGPCSLGLNMSSEKMGVGDSHIIRHRFHVFSGRIHERSNSER